MLSKLKASIQVIKINLKLNHANDMLFKLSSHIYIQANKINVKLNHAHDIYSSFQVILKSNQINDMLFILEPNHVYIQLDLKSR
jgi:hypothetical protein